MSIWKDFNDAEEPMSLNVIPKNTLVKTRLTIVPGGHNDPTCGWTGGYATCSKQTGAVYLNCKFVILTGEHAKRHLWHLIGLHSDKSEVWADMGRTFIKSLLNSARGIQPSDGSEAAKQARTIQSFADLEGLVSVIKVGVELNSYGDERNCVSAVITPDCKDYAVVMAEGQYPTLHTASGVSHPTWA